LWYVRKNTGREGRGVVLEVERGERWERKGKRELEE